AAFGRPPLASSAHSLHVVRIRAAAVRASRAAAPSPQRALAGRRARNATAVIQPRPAYMAIRSNNPLGAPGQSPEYSSPRRTLVATKEAATTKAIAHPQRAAAERRPPTARPSAAAAAVRPPNTSIPAKS